MDHPDDDAAIRAIEEAYDAAWSRGDAAALVSSFAPDAVVVNPRGQVADGKAAFEQIMAGLFASAFRGSTHTGRITRIRYPTDDVAIVDGEATLRGPELAVVHPFTDLLVRRDGRWWICDVRAYGFLPA
jgi:uncharacterized protein (TIGR02246 family)